MARAAQSRALPKWQTATLPRPGAARWLTVPRSSLPPLGEGEYYHVDLLGLPAVSDAGAHLGVVVAIENFGAGDVIEIEQPDKKRFMVPMNATAVPQWSEAQLVVAADFVEAE